MTTTSETSGTPLPGWRYGIHPHAVGLQVRSLERVGLPLGEALRLEMADPGPGGGDLVHVQYEISTSAGLWALWLTCPRADLADREAALRDLVPPPADQPPDTPLTLRRQFAAFTNDRS